MRLTLVCWLLIMSFLQACQPKPEKTKLTVVMSPWLGYYPLHYGVEQGIDAELNVKLRVVETMSASDLRRAYIKNHVDGFAISLTELNQAGGLIPERLHIALFTDYSYGADVIVAHRSVANIEDLTDAPVGFELHGLGHYVVNLAFAIQQKSPKVKHVQVNQIDAERRLKEGSIKAYVTYPPVSTKLLQNPQLHSIFDSRSTPFKIIDVLVMKDHVSPEKRQLLQQFWQSTLERIAEDPDAYLAFVAEQVGTDIEAAKKEMQGVVILDGPQQQTLENNPALITDLLKLSCGISQAPQQCAANTQRYYFRGRSLGVEL